MIVVKELCKEFRNADSTLKVLNEINTKINKGEKVAVVGPSGSGKSTFLRCLNGLEKPTSGEIIFEGIDITNPKCNLDLVRQKIGMVFQQFNLFSHLTILQNITLAPVSLKIYTKIEAEEHAKELLAKVGLTDKSNVYPVNLSGGQKQRVAIARALIMNPKVMLFDEPTSALDPETVKEVVNVMQMLAEQGMTMVVVTHEMRFVRETATRMLFMDDGKIIADDSPENLFQGHENSRVNQFISKII